MYLINSLERKFEAASAKRQNAFAGKPNRAPEPAVRRRSAGPAPGQGESPHRGCRPRGLPNSRQEPPVPPAERGPRSGGGERRELRSGTGAPRLPGGRSRRRHRPAPLPGPALGKELKVRSRRRRLLGAP